MTKLVFPDLDQLEQRFALLDLIPDTHAWLKDREGVFHFGNRLFYERFGINSLAELLGKTDYDLAPHDMASSYRFDDDRVLKGAVVTNRLELIRGVDGVEWFLTSKWPVFNPFDEIIASLGMSRHLNRAERTAIPYRELAAPIDYIREHFAGRISVAELARASNLSVSALERRFRKHLGKTPHQFLTEVRLEQARRLLQQTDLAVGSIALEVGFADHSHFTRAFSRYYGYPPSKVRVPDHAGDPERS